MLLFINCNIILYCLNVNENEIHLVNCILQNVCRQLQQDFSVSFAQILNIEIMQWPENIKYEVLFLVIFLKRITPVIFFCSVEQTVVVFNKINIKCEVLF